ncbi:hypothetical protein KEJ36_01870, partial [Candidatus Bathyarchaeota archaeon]|nr:hypothetical protein [Candidatus Bathyarchaeota archaeon]
SAHQTDRSISIVVGVHSDTVENVTITEWITYFLKGTVSIQKEEVRLETVTILTDEVTVVERKIISVERTIVKATPSLQKTLKRTVTHTLGPCVPFAMGTGWWFGKDIPLGAEILAYGYTIASKVVSGTPPILTGVFPGIKERFEVPIFNPFLETITVRLNVTGPSDWDYGMEGLLANRTAEAIFTIPANTAIIDYLAITPPNTLAEGTRETVKIKAINEVTGATILERTFLLAYDTQPPSIIASSISLDPFMTTQLITASISALDSSVGLDFFGAELHYSTDNGTTWSTKRMDWVSGNLTGVTDFTTTIGPFLFETRLLYYFTIMDSLGNTNSTDVGELELPPDPLIAENQRLREELDALNASYRRLQSDYEDLQAQVVSLLANISSLTDLIASQNQTIASLNESLEASREMIETLEGEVSDLTATVLAQNQTIASQKAQISQLQGQVSSLQGELNTTRSLMYGLAATTFIFLVTTVYFAMRRPKA